MNILKTKKLFTYMVVGALVMALSISCSAEDKGGVKEKDNTEEGNFYPPFGDYKDRKIGYSTSSGEDLTITKVSKVSENTTKIKGYAANSDGGARRFDFDISKWKKTIKDGKDIKSEAFNIVVEPDLTDISIVYYYDSSTLEITFKINGGNGYLFKGTKQP